MAPHPSTRLLSLVPLVPLLLLLALPHAPLTHAMCECGYRTPTLDIFTDALVVPSFGSVDLDAAPDFFPSAWSRDPVGDETVGTVMEKGNAVVDGQGVLGLSVRKDKKGGRVPGGEVMSTRKDISFGTFRIVMQTSAVPGSLASVSLTVDPTSSISLLLPSRLSPQALLTASMNPPQTDALGNPSTKSSQSLDVGGDPSAGWHEYRIDWLPTRTDILVDGRLLTSLTPPTTFNSSGGSVFALSHFGPGSTVSGTPPTIDATFSVLSVRLFFNSSDKARNDAYVSRCNSATNAGKDRRVCDTDSVVGTILSANDAASSGGGDQGIPSE
ncbi:glycoside hydrolase family 16 protein [Gonapodya prolifera JEL478]|uniref:Glycoside hydrolase family 16 protein n=1 Tax=Gonapodya prolifera (strain JEL478) TaxID=1344416 RepID=A0A139B0B4_GONPJ|nr:glycoside hydrolase family 16 protein [Gonapodya prolifera JEL478]|eukprot:KXS22436.1 glycoside hydrolase family 16 protein [Gonapodya prolifera JEL478]